MPIYKNVSDQPVNFLATGHMEPGEIKSVADEIDHPFLQLVDEREVTSLQGTEPDAAPATPATPVAPAAPVQQPVAAPAAPAPAPTQPAAPATVQPTVTETQGA